MQSTENKSQHDIYLKIRNEQNAATTSKEPLRIYYYLKKFSTIM